MFHLVYEILRNMLYNDYSNNKEKINNSYISPSTKLIQSSWMKFIILTIMIEVSFGKKP